MKRDEPLTIVAHSFGAVVAGELMASLEQLGYNGTLIFIDGSPLLMKELGSKQLQFENELQLQMGVLFGLMSQVFPQTDILKYKVSHKSSCVFEMIFILFLLERAGKIRELRGTGEIYCQSKFGEYSIFEGISGSTLYSFL